MGGGGVGCGGGFFGAVGGGDGIDLEVVGNGLVGGEDFDAAVLAEGGVVVDAGLAGLIAAAGDGAEDFAVDAEFDEFFGDVDGAAVGEVHAVGVIEAQGDFVEGDVSFDHDDVVFAADFFGEDFDDGEGVFVEFGFAGGEGDDAAGDDGFAFADGGDFGVCALGAVDGILRGAGICFAGWEGASHGLIDDLIDGIFGVFIGLDVGVDFQGGHEVIFLFFGSGFEGVEHDKEAEEEGDEIGEGDDPHGGGFAGGLRGFGFFWCGHDRILWGVGQFRERGGRRSYGSLFLAVAAHGGHVGAFFLGEEAEEFGFDDAGVIAGLDGEDALDDDLFGEEFFLGADGEFVEEGAADKVGPDGAVEGAEEGDLECLGDAGGLADFGYSGRAVAAAVFAAAGRCGHVFEHDDLADEGGDEAEGGAVFAHEFKHFFAMVMAFFDGGEFDVEDLLDDGGVGTVDGKLKALGEEGVFGSFDGVFEREDAIAAGDFGELDDLGDEVSGFDIFVEEAFFDVGGDAFGGVPGHGHDGEADGPAHNEDEAFSGVESSEGAVGAFVHGEDDSTSGDDETDDSCDVHTQQPCLFAVIR